MGLGVLEARWERAFNEPKIIQIGLQILAGDYFEKIIFAEYWRIFIDYTNISLKYQG